MEQELTFQAPAMAPAPGIWSFGSRYGSNS